MVGVGALYLGLLYYLYKKMHSLDKSLKETMDEMKKVMDMLNNEEFMVMDEHVPVRPTNPADQLAEAMSKFYVHDHDYDQDQDQDQNQDDDQDQNQDENENENQNQDDDENENEDENEIPKIEEITTPLRRSNKKRTYTKKPKAPPVVVFDLDAV